MGQKKSRCSAMPLEVRQLHVAVMRNNAEELARLIDAGVDVDHPWINKEYPTVKDGCTPLCEAVSLNHRRVVELLLEANASVDEPDFYGYTPLHKAAYHGRHLLAKVLLKANANVSSTDFALNTPLHVCVQNALVHNNTEIVHVLLRGGANVNATNIYGKIPLHYAVEYGAQEVTEILIKARTKIDHCDKMQNTPLHCCINAINKAQQKRALFRQHLSAMKVLIMSGCDTLNVATWIRENHILSINCQMDECMYEWYVSSQPERLKHLCRIVIQGKLKDVACMQHLPLPKILIDYLRRSLL